MRSSASSFPKNTGQTKTCRHMRQIPNIFWILLLGLALIVALRSVIDPDEPFTPESSVDMAELQSDYYLEQFRTHRYRADGALHYVIRGDHLIHYPADDSSSIQAPALTLHEEHHLWDMTSASGRFDTSPDTFTLEGSVTMTRRPRSPAPVDASSESHDNLPLQGQELVINTEDISFDINANRISTDQPITITTESWTLRSVGLESSINDGILTLLSNVEGHYEIDKIDR